MVDSILKLQPRAEALKASLFYDDRRASPCRLQWRLERRAMFQPISIYLARKNFDLSLEGLQRNLNS